MIFFKKIALFHLQKRKRCDILQRTLGKEGFVNGKEANGLQWIFTSSDESVATVENGVVTYVGVGTSTITATINETIYATCEVE